jgi:hypothetical protein
MSDLCNHINQYSRREFLSKAGFGIGGMALASLVNPLTAIAGKGMVSGTHFPPKAKRVIYLFQSGGPYQF